MIQIPPHTTPTTTPLVERHERPQASREVMMQQTAQEFETVFLTEMLKNAGVGRMTEGFNGGPGEAAFTDMLTREYAREITRSGGLGVADKVLAAMQEIGK